MAVVLLLFFCLSATAQAESVNIWIGKEAFENPEAAVQVKPDVLHVTRCSLYPWDEEKTKYSLFVEIENASDQKIAIDESELHACNAKKETKGEYADAMRMTNRYMQPGEKAIFYAGAEPYFKTIYDPKANHMSYERDDGLESFAFKISRADVLRIRLSVRSMETIDKQMSEKTDARAWIEDGRLFFEQKGTDEQMVLGVAVFDRQGRIMDVMDGIGLKRLEKGKTFSMSRSLPPYITEDMLDGAETEIYLYHWK